MTKKPQDSIDWSLTTWEGSRREELRRWSQMPLERVISALEEMAEISRSLHNINTKEPVSKPE